MSRSVYGYCYPSVPVCPTVPAREKKLSMLELRSKRPLGVYGALLRDATPLQSSVLWLTRSCFYPKERFTLEPANMIQLSKYCREYSTLTHTCQMGILRAWTRNQNTPRCGLPRKIGKRLHVFGSCMDVSLIRQLFDWLCRLWQGKSSPPTHHAPKGRAIHSPLKRRGLSSPFDVKMFPMNGHQSLKFFSVASSLVSTEELKISGSVALNACSHRLPEVEVDAQIYHLG